MKRQDSYLLFIYDFFQGDRDQLTNDIPMKLLNLTDGTIKFVYGDYGMILYIETSYKFKKVKKVVRKRLKGLVDQYFLIKQPDDISVYMPDDMMEGLFGPDNKVHKASWKPRKEHLDNIFTKVMDELYSEKPIKPFSLKEPTLDSLLDKINRDGFENLSDYEKDILKKYSNK